MTHSTTLFLGSQSPFPFPWGERGKIGTGRKEKTKGPGNEVTNSNWKLKFCPQGH